MARKPTRKPAAVRAWAVRRPDGRLIAKTISPMRSTAEDRAESWNFQTMTHEVLDWADLEKLGYRVVRVEITEAER